MNEVINKREEKKEERENKDDDLVRVLMSKLSFKLMNEFLDKVNNGNVSGKINKSSGLSWIVSKFVEGASESEIKQMRSEHFDELSMLEYVLKRAKAEGKVPDEWKAILQKQLNIEGNVTKKKKSGLDLSNHQ